MTGISLRTLDPEKIELLHRQLPSALIPMGEILATAGLISSGSVGDITLSWHDPRAGSGLETGS